MDELACLYRVTDLRTISEYLYNVTRGLPKILSQHSLRSVDEAMSKREYRFRIKQRNVLLPASSFGLAREIVARRIYEMDERFSICPGQRVVDLGANIGVFSLFAGAHGAEVLAIEAQSGLVDELAENLLRNRMNSVQPIHGIVAQSSGQFASQDARFSASHWGKDPEEIDMNGLLRDVRWTHVDFVKADVEGAEFQLFTTSDEWLNKVQRIAMEVHPEYGNVDDLASHLRKMGFVTILTDLGKRPVNCLNGAMGYVYALRQ